MHSKQDLAAGLDISLILWGAVSCVPKLFFSITWSQLGKGARPVSIELVTLCGHWLCFMTMVFLFTITVAATQDLVDASVYFTTVYSVWLTLSTLHVLSIELLRMGMEGPTGIFYFISN